MTYGRISDYTIRDKAKAVRNAILALIGEKKALTMKEIQAHFKDIHAKKSIRYNIQLLRKAGLVRRVNNLREMSIPRYALGQEV